VSGDFVIVRQPQHMPQCVFKWFKKVRYMRLFFQLLCIAMLFLFSVAVVSANETQGSIHGTVNYCGLGGLDGMQVYVPGKMFTVITDESGQFQFDGLSAGSYTLFYRKGDRLLNQNRGIQVLAGQISELGIIAFCDRKSMVSRGGSTSIAVTPAQPACVVSSDDPQCKDADGDRVVAALDCDDGNANIYPGAIEVCDGIDNNCSGVADDNVAVLVKHGMGICDAGKISITQCSNGYSDCDGQVANGCEVDLTRDDENCGSCGNLCAATESCGLGFC